MTRRKAIESATARPPMSERELGANLEDACRKLGWRYYHTIPTRRDYPHVTSVGFPDYVLVQRRADASKEARLIFAELKAAKGELTDAQTAWLSDLYHCSDVECYVWRPNDWHSGEIERVLQSPPRPELSPHLP